MRQSLPCSLQTTWNIQSPVLYRYLEKDFADAFFKDGTLRLSSFNNFSKHTDEQRKDSGEGYGNVIVKQPDGSNVSVVAGSSLNSYILCTSTLYCDEIANDFNADSGFRIDNILGFVEAISKKLPYFCGGAEGGCIYLPNKVLEVKTTQDFTNELLANEDNGFLSKINDLVNSITDLYFIKLNNYRKQCEYRLVWHSSSETDDYIDIKCPEAIKFCTKFEDLTVEKKVYKEEIKKEGWHLSSGQGQPSVSKITITGPKSV